MLERNEDIYSYSEADAELDFGGRGREGLSCLSSEKILDTIACCR